MKKNLRMISKKTKLEQFKIGYFGYKVNSANYFAIIFVTVKVLYVKLEIILSYSH
jgi:hypothetical protein